MSGLTASEIALRKEKAEKLKSIGKIAEMRRKLAGLSSTLKSTLQETPQGVKTTFEKEVAAGLSWIQRLEQMEIPNFTMDSNLGAINEELAALENHFEIGHSTFDVLTGSLTQKADALEKSHYSSLAQLKCTYAGCQESIKTWFEIDTVNKIENLLIKTGDFLRQKQLSQAGSCLTEIESTVSSKIQEAQELEYKHQKRLYVLKALRQVCTEMGFEESEPSFEKPGNRNRIVYEVDTFSQGKIRFFLTLEGISSHSNIVQSRCLDEFDKLSASLDEEFGVKTKFKILGEIPRERLIRKGEIDLPEGTQMERNA